MSFYFEDEPQTQGTNNGGEEDFCCINCGGTEYYVETGGALCCSSCFTQSQQLTQEATELDVEEVQALAARTSTGRVFATKLRRTGRGAQQAKKPLSEFDSSVPFPNLVTCIHGIQQVMKHCTERLCDLVGLSEETIMETVQKLWMSYLRAWTDGAEFYGKLHPEIRFSLRDSFLPFSYKTKVMKHLSHKAALVVRAELDAKKETKDESSSAILDTKPPAREDIDSDSDEEDDIEDDTEDYVSLTKDHIKTIRHFAPTYHNPKSLMCMYWNKGKRGRLEAALITLPSMKFVASLLWLAVSRAGVTLNHVRTWIANGALPLQNAFARCLSRKEQESLTHVASFFRISKLPTLDEMETVTDKIVVACGLKSFAHLYGMVPTAAPGGEARAPLPDTVASRDNGEPSPPANEIRQRSDFSYITPRSVPLLTARLVDDLGFGQDVLDRSLALMGISKGAPCNLWLPAPLQMALPKNLGTTAQVLAVIAVACRMTPGWETWVYPGPTAARTDATTNLDVVVSSKQGQVNHKRQQIDSEARRFVPYNEDQLRLLRNGPTAEGYLDYLESNMLDEKDAIFPKFRSSLESSSIVDEENDSDSSSLASGDQEIVEKPSILKAPRNPMTQQRIWRRQKMHDWKLRVRRKRAQWANANCLGDYVIYNDPLTHAKDRKRRGKGVLPTPEPFHPQYGLLLEYMSFTTNVKPSKIHEAITVLDDEILSLVNPDAQPKPRRKKRKPSQPVAQETKADESTLSAMNETNVETWTEGVVVDVAPDEEGGNDLTMVAV